MVSALIDYDTRKWRANLVKSIFFLFEARTILNIPISYNLSEEKLFGPETIRVFLLSKVPTMYVALNMVNSSEEGESSCRDPRDRLWKKFGT